MATLVGRGQRFLGGLSATIEYPDERWGTRARKIRVVGSCMGGALAFAAACGLPDRVAAAASFHGGGIVNLPGRANRVSAPLHLFFGGQDAFIPPDQVRRIEQGLQDLGKEFTVKTYGDADHGFFNEERLSVYKPMAAADAWSEVTEFFENHLERVPECAVCPRRSLLSETCPFSAPSATRHVTSATHRGAETGDTRSRRLIFDAARPLLEGYRRGRLGLRPVHSHADCSLRSTLRLTNCVRRPRPPTNRPPGRLRQSPAAACMAKSTAAPG